MNDAAWHKRAHNSARRLYIAAPSAALFSACTDSSSPTAAASAPDCADVMAATGPEAGATASDSPTTSLDPAPTISLAANGGAAEVTGVVKLVASASDDIGVTHVQFFLDGVQLVDDTAFPFQYEWNSAPTAEGKHKLAAVN